MALSNPSHSVSQHHLPTSPSSSDFSSPQLSPAYLSDASVNASLSDSTISDPLSVGAAAGVDDVSDRHVAFKNRQSLTSNKANRSGIFGLAQLARDKTTSAIASFTEPPIRSRHSSSNLARQQSSSNIVAPPLPTAPAATASTEKTHNHKTSGASETLRASRSNLSLDATRRSQNSTPVNNPRASLLNTDPPSSSYDSADSTQPKPIVQNTSKMHQTSSRLLRMTDDERPFTRDFKDLFATLVVSLPLQTHRVRLSKVEHSFLSEEAINNLGSLKFSQSNRMPDPKDPSRIVTTTTTTTFSMAREMARSVCQRFLEARFIESADGKQLKEFTMKGNVWQLTPKGIHVLDRFCSKNGIQQRHVTDLVNSAKNTMQLVLLERDSTTDKISSDRSTIEVIFRRFIGQNGPNIKSSSSSADSDSLSEYKDGLNGVKMAAERKLGTPPRTVYQTFTGKAAADWLMDCCTTIDRHETSEIATLFIEHDLMWCVQVDRSHVMQYPHESKFQPTKNAIYQMTQKGKDVVNMTGRERASHGDEAAAPRAGVSRDSNTQKLDKILNDAALRLLFRENLRDTHCEENLSFYQDVDEFLRACKNAIRIATAKNGGKGGQGLDAVKETMASAYGIYNAFLAPGSPCELNIDHMLRNQLATRMTKAVGQDAAMIESLKEVTKLFEEAQISVFKLMASDSVPKFMKSVKYEQTLKNYDFDSIATNGSTSTKNSTPERSMSKSQR